MTALGLAASIMAGGAQAQTQTDAEKFYTGKTVDFLIGSAPVSYTHLTLPTNREV